MEFRTGVRFKLWVSLKRFRHSNCVSVSPKCFLCFSDLEAIHSIVKGRILIPKKTTLNPELAIKIAGKTS